MINWNDFEEAVVNHLNRDISRQNNPNQNDAVRSSLNQPLFIVAGPGSGKTTVIALRVLKLIFVDDIEPSTILATTFTRKAAAELRSRILGWGDQLRHLFMLNPGYIHVRNQLRKINFNHIITGTLDNIAEEILGDYRAPGVPSPLVIEDFVSNALMIRVGLFIRRRHNNQELRNYIAKLKGTSWGLNLSEISATLREVKDRFYHDKVDVSQFRNSANHPGIPVLCDAINDYELVLQSRLLFDFARLEQEFLTRIRDGTLGGFLQDIRFVLVDEYQDTNLLQEQIYFELTRAALNNEGSITVVGDDDQSLYRFRGATVDLFQSFLPRINSNLGIQPRTISLSQNYRSTQIVVNFCNRFINLDPSYKNARVQNKPEISPMRSQPYINYPILGMFRDDVNLLASDLARFVHKVIHGGGVQVQDDNNNQYTIEINIQKGTPADIVLLCSSPREFDAQGRPRLPMLLRHQLNQLSPPIQVFNPRGENLETIENVQILCGLILECIDPNGSVQKNEANIPKVAINMFDSWRKQASKYINGSPPPTRPRSLEQFVNAWQRRTPLGRKKWEREVPLIDLVYKLVTWLPNMQNDIEGLVYLEAITRTICQAGLFGNFGGQIIFDPRNLDLETASIREALWNIFVPMATGAIEIDEDLLDTLPPDRLNIMSIHQAKGLEFPLVIVDVGSDFRDLRSADFKRFPRNGGKSCNMEDELRPYSPLGQPKRAALDRAFDDLVRQYFVAFSRAQDVLLLVGLNSIRHGYYTQSGQKAIPNIATGWDRNGNWHWGEGLHNLIHL